jgi:hypothetical protein
LHKSGPPLGESLIWAGSVDRDEVARICHKGQLRACSTLQSNPFLNHGKEAFLKQRSSALNKSFEALNKNLTIFQIFAYASARLTLRRLMRLGETSHAPY